VERRQHTPTSTLLFGTRHGQPVVIKLSHAGTAESRSGHVLTAFGGRGVVRLLDTVGGALLLEQLQPGTRASSVVDHSDDEATDIISGVVATMTAQPAVASVPSAFAWGEALTRHDARIHAWLPLAHVDAAMRAYCGLCRSQRAPRLLHGDLHHDNVILDAKRGWVAIDPQGVSAESEFELGAAIRNPVEHASLITDLQTLQRRVDRYTSALRMDARRIMAWAWTQTVLALLWMIEDGEVGDTHPWPLLAERILTRLSQQWPSYVAELTNV